METQHNVWFVMRSLFNTELKTKRKLDEAGIRNFIPMDCRVQVLRGCKRKTYVPVVRNLMFVYSDETTLAPFLAADSKFQYTYRRGGRRNEPMVVPDEQMEEFMNALEKAEHPLFFTADELDVTRGTRIRVIGGPLDGIKGIFMKVQGARSKRLVVMIPETMAVAVSVDPDLIEVLEKE